MAKTEQSHLNVFGSGKKQMRIEILETWERVKKLMSNYNNMPLLNQRAKKIIIIWLLLSRVPPPRADRGCAQRILGAKWLIMTTKNKKMDSHMFFMVYIWSPFQNQTNQNWILISSLLWLSVLTEKIMDLSVSQTRILAQSTFTFLISPETL